MRQEPFNLYNLSHADKAANGIKPLKTWFEDTPGKPTGLILGLDLGRQSDYSAVVICQRVAGERVEYRKYSTFADEPLEPFRSRPLISHNLLRLHRYPLGTSYVDVASSVRGVMQQLQDGHGKIPELILDVTGVGRAVGDALTNLHGLKPVAATITGGTNWTRENRYEWRVAKKSLASTLDVVLSEKRLQVPAAEPLAEVLVRELRDFSVKVTASGNEQYASPDRAGMHDDILMATALAVFLGENQPKPARIQPIFQALRA